MAKNSAYRTIVGFLLFTFVLCSGGVSANSIAAAEGDTTAASLPDAAGHGEINWFQWRGAQTPPVGWMFVNFAIFLGTLYLLLGKKMRSGLKARQSAVSDAIAAAREKQEAAEKALAHARERSDSLDQLVNKLEVQITGAANERCEVMLAEANQRAERIKKHALHSLHHELDLMAEKMRRQVVDDLMEKVEARITARLDAEVNTVVSEDYLRVLDSVSGETGGSNE